MPTNLNTASPASRVVAPEIRTYRRTRVYYADSWSDSDSGWRRLTWFEALAAEEGFGARLGSAQLRQVYGLIRQPDGDDVRSYTPGIDRRVTSTERRPLGGKLIRLSLEDADNPDKDSLLEHFWYGVVTDETRTIDGRGNRDVSGVCSYRCAGLGMILHRIIPARGHELNGSTEVSDPGELLPFNAVPGGDMSDSTHFGSYIHDRDNSQTLWTAKDVVEYLLTQFANAGGTSMRWSLEGQTGALNFSESWDLRGLSLFECLNVLISSRLGLTWRIKVGAPSGAGSGVRRPIIEVDSTVKSAVTVESLTIPAASRQTDVDIKDELWLQDAVTYREDHTNVYDDIRIVGRRPWSVITLAWIADEIATSDLEKGWTAAEETAWDAATEEERAQPDLAHVWRLWRLRSDWNGVPFLLDEGTTFIDGALRNVRNQVTSDLYGEEGYDGQLRHYVESGDRQEGTTLPEPARFAIRPERILPVHEGYNYDERLSAGDLPAAVDRTRNLVPPKVFIAEDGSTWVDKTTDYQVQMLGDDWYVLLGRTAADAQSIQTLLSGASARLAVTVGIRDPLPLIVSWKRNRSQWANGVPRQITIPTGHEQWYAYEKAAFRAVGGQLKQIEEGRMLRDEVPRMREVLALAKLWYAEPDRSLQWSEAGTVDTSTTLAPGAYIDQAKAGDFDYDVQAVVTSRSWDLTEANWSTSYQTQRILPVLGAQR